jgi:hypothetical protein
MELEQSGDIQNSADDSSTIEAESQTQGTPESTEQSLVDLDSTERFKFQGREWTPQELQKAYMMQADYTRKTQAISEERKYWDNLEADLAKIKSEPQLMSQFMQIYPRQFHKFLDYVSTQQATSQSTMSQPNQGPRSIAELDPQFYRDYQTMKLELTEKNVQAIEAELDAKFSTLSKKYPFADEQAILAKAQVLIDQKQTPNWEKLWKENNERLEKVAKEYYSKQVNAQKQANRRGKDIPPGGGVPGQAPVKPKTIKEASKFALEELENN